LHEPLTITSTATPEECIQSVTSSSASEGVATFLDVQFSGFAGICSFQFLTYFDAAGNPSANSGATLSIQRRLISSTVSIITSLPSHSLVSDSSYFFSGVLPFLAAIIMLALCHNLLSVGIKVGSDFIRAHDAISIITEISPSSCIINQHMQPLLNGIATFSQTTFSGYIGVCSMQFKAYFNDIPNNLASYQQSEPYEFRLIATKMVMKMPLPQTTLVAGAQYSFTG
jgi:hypothetical protein